MARLTRTVELLLRRGMPVSTYLRKERETRTPWTPTMISKQ